MIYEAGEIVVVPFPFTDRAVTKRRPALILSDARWLGRDPGHSVLAMVTSAKQSAWPLDVPVSEGTIAGLDIPCVIRMKLFTLDNRFIVRRLGQLGPVDRAAVSAAIRLLFGPLL